MDETGENRALLQRSSIQECGGYRGKTLRFFCTLTLVLMFFKGGEEMASTTQKQYIYAWSENYVNVSHRTTINNASFKQNTSIHVECPGNHKISKTVEHEAQVLASNWELYFSVMEAVLLFLSSSIYGTLSDYMGRKPFICLSVLGYCLRITFLVIIIYYRLHIAFLFVSYFVDGVCGSSFAFSLFSYTMTADVTHGTKDRVLGITIIEMLIGIGRSTTQFATGYFINATNFFYPILTATMFIFVSLFLAIFCLTETHQQLTNVPLRDSVRRYRVPGVRTLVRNYIGFYVFSDSSRQIFLLCFSVFLLLEFGTVARYDSLTLYQLGSPFCWTSEKIGWYNCSMVVICYVIGLALLKPLQCCVPEYLSACLGLVSAIAFNVVTAFAKTTVELFIAIPVGIFMMLPKSILRGMASSRASGNKQGAIFAGLQSSELICELVASPVSLVIYSHTLYIMKGVVFLVISGVNVIALVIMGRLSVMLMRTDKHNPQSNHDTAGRQLTDPCQ